MAKVAKKLNEKNVFYTDGTPCPVVVSDTVEESRRVLPTERSLNVKG